MEIAAIILSTLNLAVLVILLVRSGSKAPAEALRERIAALGAQLSQMSADRAAQESHLRRELGERIENLSENQSRRLIEIANNYAQQQEKLNATVSNALRELREENARKLDEMRKTVDEKLESTLSVRLGESFKSVTEQLERLYESFGKMQELGEGVNSLTRVLTNVKTRGTWGEVQLKNILEQILAPSQYEENVRPVPRSNLTVEFAVKLPGRGEGEFIYLPVDSKFPQEDYLRIVEASEHADRAALESAQNALYARILSEARDIKKYISEPYTTSFAILFIPTESVYAEVIRNSALVEDCQSKYHVVIAGPTTFAALLNSLSLGFRTLAIERKSSEVWKLLSAIKTQYAQFGALVDKSMRKLDEAHNTMSDVQNRSRIINNKLDRVQELSPDEARTVLTEGEPGSGDPADSGS